ncbi:MAG: histidine kinase [Chitinophagaceae bacterium]
MAKSLFRKNASLLVHIIAWVLLAFIVLYYHPITWGIVLPLKFWLKQVFLLGIMMAVFYFNINFLIPFLLEKRNHRIIYIGAILVLVVAGTALNSISNKLFGINTVMATRALAAIQPNRKTFGFPFETFIPTVILLLIGFGTTISFIRKWQTEVLLRQKYEQEKVSTELQFLKAQINPHFFFNTLNNIYSYTLTDGDIARTAITNLSKMMRYVLYDSQNGQVFLGQELNFLNDYIELMKLRLTGKTLVKYEFPAQVKEIILSPMLFLPLVENAFKHGTSNVEHGFITVTLQQLENEIELSVRNTIFGKQRQNVETSNGIGLANTQRRLDLLYPGKHVLITGINANNEYEATLKLFTR